MTSLKSYEPGYKNDITLYLPCNLTPYSRNLVCGDNQPHPAYDFLETTRFAHAAQVARQCNEIFFAAGRMVKFVALRVKKIVKLQFNFIYYEGEVLDFFHKVKLVYINC